MDNEPQTLLGPIDTLVARLDDALGVLDTLVDGPFDDLVGRSLTDAALADALVDRLDVMSADLHRSISALRQRLASAAERRRAQRRFTREGVEAILDDLATKRPASARRRWLAELAAALAVGERNAVQLLLAQPAGIDDSKRAAIVALSDEVLDQIDEIVAPGADSGPMGALYTPPALTQASLLRRPAAERRAA